MKTSSGKQHPDISIKPPDSPKPQRTRTPSVKKLSG